jgi:hypothetical protein
MIDADPHRPVRPKLPRRGDHVECAGDRGADRLVELRKQIGGRHEGVADRLDLFEPVLCRSFLEAVDPSRARRTRSRAGSFRNER